MCNIHEIFTLHTNGNISRLTISANEKKKKKSIISWFQLELLLIFKAMNATELNDYEVIVNLT